MSTRDQEQGKDTEEREDTEDTEGHVYVPKDERAGGTAGLPERRAPIADEDQRRTM